MSIPTDCGLLLSLELLSATEPRMTQELIASMPGVRREGVTEASLKLQNDGLIHYTLCLWSVRMRTEGCSPTTGQKAPPPKS